MARAPIRSFRVEDDEWAKIQTYAVAVGMPTSAFLRVRCLEAPTDNEKKLAALRAEIAALREQLGEVHDALAVLEGVEE